jgi:hypothetical protein
MGGLDRTDLMEDMQDLVSCLSTNAAATAQELF